MPKFRTFIVLFVVVLASSFTVPSQTGTVHAQQEQTPMSTEPVVDKEMIRNGQFNVYGQYGEPNGWVKTGTGSGVEETSGQDGGPAMAMEGISETEVFLHQQLRLPSTTTAVTMEFDYRLQPTYGGIAQLNAYVAADTAGASPWTILATVPASQVVNSATGWQHVAYPLTSSEVDQV